LSETDANFLQDFLEQNCPEFNFTYIDWVVDLTVIKSTSFEARQRTSQE
jgi:hypothetical protein